MTWKRIWFTVKKNLCHLVRLSSMNLYSDQSHFKVIEDNCILYKRMIKLRLSALSSLYAMEILNISYIYISHPLPPYTKNISHYFQNKIINWHKVIKKEIWTQSSPWYIKKVLIVWKMWIELLFILYRYNHHWMAHSMIQDNHIQDNYHICPDPWQHLYRLVSQG